MTVIRRAWEAIHRRRLAYVRTFCGDFSQPHPEAQRVLADLRRYCGINKGGIVISPVTRMADPIATAYRAGQRDVFLRIAGYLGLDESQLEESDHVQESTRTANGA